MDRCFSCDSPKYLIKFSKATLTDDSWDLLSTKLCLPCIEATLRSLFWERYPEVLEKAKKIRELESETNSLEYGLEILTEGILEQTMGRKFSDKFINLERDVE